MTRLIRFQERGSNDVRYVRSDLIAHARYSSEHNRIDFTVDYFTHKEYFVLFNQTSGDADRLKETLDKIVEEQ